MAEKDQYDREKWEIIQKARHAAEQAVFLQTQSESREQHIAKLEIELSEVLTLLVFISECDNRHMVEVFSAVSVALYDSLKNAQSCTFI